VQRCSGCHGGCEHFLGVPVVFWTYTAHGPMPSVRKIGVQGQARHGPSRSRSGSAADPRGGHRLEGETVRPIGAGRALGRSLLVGCGSAMSGARGGNRERRTCGSRLRARPRPMERRVGERRGRRHQRSAAVRTRSAEVGASPRSHRTHPKGRCSHCSARATHASTQPPTRQSRPHARAVSENRRAAGAEGRSCG
jgi:hypothetical protein